MSEKNVVRIDTFPKCILILVKPYLLTKKKVLLEVFQFVLHVIRFFPSFLPFFFFNTVIFCCTIVIGIRSKHVSSSHIPFSGFLLSNKALQRYELKGYISAPRMALMIYGIGS